MKTNWQTKKLGDVCDFQNGFAFKSKLFKELGFPVLRISNIQNDGISYNRLVFFDKKNYKEDFDKYQALKGDLVIAMSGATTGKLAICDADEIFYLNQRVGKFKPKKDLSKDYLYHFLSTRIEENLRISAGSAQPNLSTEQIKDFKIPLPSLPEQMRIVKILDEVFEKVAKAKENAEKNLQNVKELFNNYLQSLFGNKSNSWEEKELGEIIEIRNGKSQKIVLSETGKYPIMGSAGNVMGYSTDYICEAETTIIGRKGNISKPLFINERFWNVDTAFGLYPKNEKEVDKKFVYYLCLTIDFGKMNRGTTIPSLVKSELQTIQITIPKSISEQKAIVKKLNALSAETKKLEAIYRQKLANLEELKKSVLKKAFNGEI